MPGISSTQIITGPAIFTYRGATFRSQGDVTLDSALDLFPIETGILGVVDQRVREEPIRLRFVPDGEWSNLTVLFPYQNPQFGDYIMPVRTLGAIVGTECNIGYTSPFISGDAVIPQAYGGTLTTGLTAGQLYFIHVYDTANISFHGSYSSAVAGTNPIAISAGSGTSRIVMQNPLTIQTQAGVLINFFNAAVVQMPEIIGSTVATTMGEVIFEVFIADGQDWATNNSRYTITASAWPGDTTFNPSAILTQPITAAWGASLPWSNISTKNGWRIGFELGLAAVEVDNEGVINRRIESLVARARAIPIGIQESDLYTALLLQGTGAQRGRSLSASSSNLNLTSANNNFYVRVYNAGLQGGPEMFSLRTDRTGELTWVSTRGILTGIPLPIFFAGTSSIS